jgi:hypothetical protein
MTIEIISIFPLWTFHLYVATFQHDLHMEYISPLIKYSLEFLDRGLVITQKLLNQRFLVVNWSQLFICVWLAMIFWLPSLKICVTNDHNYVPLAIVTVPYSFSSLMISTRFVTEVTRRVPLVEQYWVTLAVVHSGFVLVNIYFSV